MPGLWPVGAYSHCLPSPFDMILGVLDFSYFYWGKKYLENRLWVLGVLIFLGHFSRKSQDVCVGFLFLLLFSD